ncbi:MAG: protein kinase, partial [Paraprevotella sp.]|nr:protein kinase [Paraprevotella sp.]
NIIHRDIKPHNIIMTEDGILKVTDFGIARALNSNTITVCDNTMGSVHYFSPEQARGGYTDEKSDIYSLGVLMYEMLTGRLSFIIFPASNIQAYNSLISICESSAIFLSPMRKCNASLFNRNPLHSGQVTVLENWSAHFCTVAESSASCIF